ncbi:MAG: FlgD immunoglobulin-like domain containing protein [Candidatus Cloacimonetes bacterium]|nr:FlgD immunoglobulin-like domain containing protein [Candidatus Cloacimonadota bacterium]
MTIKTTVLLTLVLVPVLCMGIVWDNFLTVDPSLPISSTNLQDIQDAISIAHGLPGNTQVTIVSGTFDNIAVTPWQSNKALRLLGTRISENNMTTIVQQGDDETLCYIEEIYSTSGNTVIIDNIKFVGAYTAIEVFEANSLQVFVENCVFSGQLNWTIDANLPISINNCKFDLPGQQGYALGAIRMMGIDYVTVPLKTSITNCTFTGYYSRRIIEIGRVSAGMTMSGLTIFDVEISNNFFNMTENGNVSYVEGTGAVQVAGSKYTLINRNVFHLDSVYGSSAAYQIKVYNPVHTSYPQRILRIMNNTLYYTGSENPFGGISVHKAHTDCKIMNNVIANMEGTGVHFWDTAPAACSYVVQYNSIYNCGNGIVGAGSEPNWSIGNQLTGIPLLHSVSAGSNKLKPYWETDARSILIDSGAPNLTLNDFKPTDPPDNTIQYDFDYTPLDVGAYPTYRWHNFDKWNLQLTPNNQGWNWKGFPVMDMVYEDGTTVEDVVKIAWNLIEKVSINSTLTAQINPQSSLWENIDYNMNRNAGYKVQVNATHDLSISGTRVVANSTIPLEKLSEDNWVGYWLQTPQNPITALGSFESDMIEIKAQYWTLVKINGMWVLPAGGRMPSLSYGDMVILKCSRDISNFKWNAGDPVPPKGIEFAKSFTWEEKADYAPLFLDLSDLEEDLPKEIGIMLGDTCKGAVIVDSSMVQLNAYIMDLEDEDIQNLTFTLEYGSKSSRAITSRYQIYGGWNKAASSLKTTDAVFVKLFAPDHDPELVFPLSLSQNSPNPFNKSTRIGFSLPGKGTARLSIYNLKGQKVKTHTISAVKAGKFEYLWDGKDERDIECASGIYLYKIEAEGKSMSKKMMLFK